LPIGAVYAHLIFSEDMTVQRFLQGHSPLYEGEWVGKTGVSIPMPPMDEHWSAAHEAWAHAVVIDLDQLKKYSQAVYGATDTYLAGLSDSDLETEVDLGAWGKKSVAYMLTNFVYGHTFSLAGEISALKGIQGAKGYPF